ncbi:GNAT family N-acetyltransferase [Alkalilimnicola ehrlichii MLHE-1]|uniref:GCN5-related N-acetyltransferase n=1 Tax=Alkalilimnicola ehrlichii (strain ATCC BAA-1101 / DSM 17681 / MLHE-1) TaxID=187272 RepID=Q0AB77_ALKEH|nr:GNAT family protein [Alkalilimnicola ehrlichii]ABI55910.1 GCN5-related N-acetyltransferase [Alkalilimnicola ehrlichii MLHE-1]
MTQRVAKSLQEREVQAKDGQRYLLRPIRPSDAPSLMRGYQALSPQERWFRMLHAVPELSEDAARAFCNPDLARDFCLVLEGQDGLAGEIVGGARITGEANGRDCEFSVSLRPEVRGLGLAQAALRMALQAAAEAGYERVYGTIARDNRGMIHLAVLLGFNIRQDPDDPAFVIAEKAL